MPELGDLVVFKAAERHRTKTVKGGQELAGSVYHHAHDTFAGIIEAEAAPLPPADAKGKPIPQFVIGLFVPEKPNKVSVTASEGAGPGQFKVR